MQAQDAVKELKARSGKSGVQISADLGKSPNWLGQTISQGSTPKADTLAAIARVCGYRLQLEGPRGDKIEIDPPKR